MGLPEAGVGGRIAAIGIVAVIVFMDVGVEVGVAVQERVINIMVQAGV